MSAVKIAGQWWRNKMASTDFFEIRLRGKINAHPKLNISKLAGLLGISTTQIHHYVNGYEMPPDHIQCLIAKYLGCTTRDEIWCFREDLFPELDRIHRLHCELTKLEYNIQEKLKKKNDDNESM